MTDQLKKEFLDLLAALKGKDVLISGTTVNGVTFTDRRLNNVTAGLRNVVGFDPVAGGVRSFRTGLLTRIVLAPDQTEKGAAEAQESRVA